MNELTKYNPHDPKLKALCLEVKTLHEENRESATRVAGNVALIGMKLHQIKAVAGHGNFEKAIPELLPGVSEGARFNYMRLAERMVIEKLAVAMLNPPGGKSSTVEDLAPAENAAGLPSLTLAHPAIVEKATAQAEKLDWLNLPFKFEKLVKQQIDGKTIMEALRGYGVVREKKPDGGFRPNANAVEAWLRKHHIELAGTKFDDLPPTIQKEFKKQWKPPQPNADELLESEIQEWRDAVKGLMRLVDADRILVLPAFDKKDAIIDITDALKKLNAATKEKK